MAKSRDQGPFRKKKLESTQIVSPTFVDIKTLSISFKSDIILYLFNIKTFGNALPKSRVLGQVFRQNLKIKVLGMTSTHKFGVF